MRWWEGRMAGMDLETTAADPEEARIVSAAFVFVGGGQPTETATWLVDPGVEIPAEATEIHGITTEQARAEGISTAAVLEELVIRLARAHDKGWPVIIQNARYDLTVADRELRRLGMEPQARLLPLLMVVDPLVLDRHLDRYRPKRVASHSLEDCCRVWNVKLDMAHNAAFDAIAACRLAYRLARNGYPIRRVRDAAELREVQHLTDEWEWTRHDLPELVEWQRQIAWADAERLEAYFRAGDERKGVPPQPDRVVPREWPIIPVR